jgi:glycosyltransferase involved in cell wall biosynthesis
MIDSKFDDYPRTLWREVFKALMLAPYQGVLAGSRRTASYMFFLGFRRRPVVVGFDRLDLARIRRLGTGQPVPGHGARDFLIVARLVEKKNLAFALRAYAAWSASAANPRRLRIVGYGHLETALRELAAELGIADRVIFMGVADSAQVFRTMGESLCLILPSIEEQFGFVVIEALALGLPVLVSSNAGAVDELIDNGVNGWIVDPYRPAALIAAMALLDRDEAVWTAASEAAWASAERGDVRHFVAGVAALLGRSG